MIDFRDYLGEGATGGQELGVYHLVVWWTRVGEAQWASVTASGIGGSGGAGIPGIRLTLQDFSVDLRADGEATVRGRGEVVLAGTPISFDFNDPRASYEAGSGALNVEFAVGRAASLTFRRVNGVETEVVVIVDGITRQTVRLAPGKADVLPHSPQDR